MRLSIITNGWIELVLIFSKWTQIWISSCSARFDSFATLTNIRTKQLEEKILKSSSRFQHYLLSCIICINTNQQRNHLELTLVLQEQIYWKECAELRNDYIQVMMVIYNT